jgi:hypothetical protein
MKSMYVLVAGMMTFLVVSCSEGNKETEAKTTARTEKQYEDLKALDVKYSVLAGKKEIARFADSLSPSQQHVLMTVNRTDLANIKKQDTILVPDNLDGQVRQYVPFPQTAPYLKDVRKIVFFSYPSQTFAAYEYGHLVYAGPTNMGRQKDPTPTGLYYANWKAEQTTSTFNDEWELKWNFNIENKEGIGWHQYELPGYPASHSCLRMLEADAKHMYEWADEWTLKGTDNVLAKGTPVIVFGSYPFGGAKPWLQLTQNPKALDITEDMLKTEVSPHLTEILKEQANTEGMVGKKR